jgi:hypothetical protein
MVPVVLLSRLTSIFGRSRDRHAKAPPAAMAYFAIAYLEHGAFRGGTVSLEPGDIAPLEEFMDHGNIKQQGGEIMKALILYVGLVVAGAALSSLLGVYLDHTFNATVSLIVFLACFFTNFAISWIIVIHIMDGTLKADA